MISQYLKYFLFICLGVFIQSALGRLFSFSPDFLLVLVIALAFLMQNAAGVIVAFFLGLLSDLSSGVYLGPFAASYVCVFCFAGAISRRVFADKFIAIMGITFMSCLVKSLVLTLFIYYFTENSILNLKTYLIEAALCTLISPLVFALFMGRILRKPKSRSLGSMTYSKAG